MSSLIDPCLTFLQVHRWTQQSESDLESSTTVAKVLFVTARHDPGVVGRLNEQDVGPFLDQLFSRLMDTLEIKTIPHPADLECAAFGDPFGGPGRRAVDEHSFCSVQRFQFGVRHHHSQHCRNCTGDCGY